MKSPISNDWVFWIWIAYTLFIWVSQLSGRLSMGSGIAGVIDLAFTPIVSATVIFFLILIPRSIIRFIVGKIRGNQPKELNPVSPSSQKEFSKVDHFEVTISVLHKHLLNEEGPALLLINPDGKGRLEGVSNWDLGDLKTTASDFSFHKETDTLLLWIKPPMTLGISAKRDDAIRLKETLERFGVPEKND